VERFEIKWHRTQTGFMDIYSEVRTSFQKIPTQLVKIMFCTQYILFFYAEAKNGIKRPTMCQDFSLMYILRLCMADRNHGPTRKQ